MVFVTIDQHVLNDAIMELFPMRVLSLIGISIETTVVVLVRFEFSTATHRGLVARRDTPRFT